MELTEAGEQVFGQLRDVAFAFDKQLRRGISAAETSALEDLLGRLEANVGSGAHGMRPWAGLAEGGSPSD